MKKITITIAADGEVKIAASGFAGASCQKATAEIERALGVVKDRAKTAEYFARQQNTGSEKVSQ